MMKASQTFIILAFLVSFGFSAEYEQDTIEDAADRGYFRYYLAKAGQRCGRKRYCFPFLICQSHICKIRTGKRCTKFPKLCQSGSICIGTDKKKKCVVPSGLGGRCGTRFTACKTGLVCEGKKCAKPKIPLGGDCKPSGSVCEDGLTCGNTAKSKTCVKIRGPGESCKKTQPFFVCKTGLTCAEEICKTPKGGDCAPKGSVCVSGTTCIASKGQKKCVAPSDVGEVCGKPFTLCKTGLVCEDGKCAKPKIPLGGNCAPAGSVCEDGLTCARTGGKRKQCVRIRGPGESCKKADRFFICKTGLVCAQEVCKTPENGDCMPKGSICVSGAVCVGRPSKKRCVFPRGVGRECGTNPFRICKKGLECRKNRCAKPKVPLGGSCRPAGSVCEDGLACVRTGRKKKTCVRIRGPGETCKKSEPFFVCKTSLVCTDEICKTPVGGDCAPKGSVCVSGSLCVAFKSRKKCVVPGGVGSRCGKPFTLCKTGLECRDGKCAKPKIPLGGDCRPAGSICEDGLTCAKTGGKKKTCVKIRGPGETCKKSQPFFICSTGLVCADEICKTPVGGNCTPKGSICVSGSFCIAFKSRKKCVVPGDVGATCGKPFTLCKKGLECRDGKCAKPKIPLGGDCRPAGSVCEDGLTCARTGGKRKRCVKIRGPGETCKKTQPFFICKAGLVCSGELCKVPENGDCAPKGSICIPGAVCVGRPSKKRCVFPRGLGRECGTNPFRICKKGLVCRGNKCSLPIVPVGGDCRPRGSVCARGSTCITKRKKSGIKKICIVLAGKGDRCDRPNTLCKGALLCFRRRCVSPRRKFGELCGGAVRCESGLSCVHLRYLRKALCVRFSSRGKRCGRNVLCPHGLRCIRGKCMSRKHW